MLHLDVGSSEALDAFLEELQRQVRFVGGETLTDALDEDGVVGRNAQTSNKQQHVTFTTSKPVAGGKGKR